MTMTQVAYPVAPTVTPRKSTLLDVANEDPNFTWHDGLALYDSFNCMSFGSYADFCESPPGAKDLDQQANWVDGFRFAAYGGFTCRPIGLEPDFQSKVEQSFRNGESAAVERALMDTRFVASAGSTAVPAVWAAAPDINSAAAVSAKQAIALLEEYAASVYVGAPTLHVPVAVASILLNDNVFVWDGDILRTGLGAKVAVGAGYGLPNNGPTGAPAAAGQRWVYATGEVTYARSDTINQSAIDTTNNNTVVLIERGYLLSVDCFTAAIRATI